MTDQEILFCTLCGPLEDAIELMDNGQVQEAKALLERIILQAQNLLSGELSGKPETPAER